MESLSPADRFTDGLDELKDIVELSIGTSVAGFVVVSPGTRGEVISEIENMAGEKQAKLVHSEDPEEMRKAVVGFLNDARDQVSQTSEYAIIDLSNLDFISPEKGSDSAFASLTALNVGRSALYSAANCTFVLINTEGLEHLKGLQDLFSGRGFLVHLEEK